MGCGLVTVLAAYILSGRWRPQLEAGERRRERRRCELKLQRHGILTGKWDVDNGAGGVHLQ